MTIMPKSEEDSSQLAPLGREEYIEQAQFFRALSERLKENVPAQEVLASVREEVLATTKLPMAIDFLSAELRHAGAFSTAMLHLEHYFTPFQSFVVQTAENERGRFDLWIGLEILGREAEYRAADPTRQGIFLYQFEAISRNRLGYDRGLDAVARDPAFDATWSDWIRTIRRQIGMVDLADLIYVHSEHYQNRQQRAGSSPGLANADESTVAAQADSTRGVILFGDREGRIALANRRKDPLYFFASLHRQLGYPEVPRPTPPVEQALLPQLARRVEQMETRLKLIEEEQRGGIDLTQFYQRPGEGRPPGAGQ
jgi:hypothetical protein